MCALNNTKKGSKAFSYLFRTHLAITVSATVSGNFGDVFSRHSVCHSWVKTFFIL